MNNFNCEMAEIAWVFFLYIPHHCTQGENFQFKQQQKLSPFCDILTSKFYNFTFQMLKCGYY